MKEEAEEKKRAVERAEEERRRIEEEEESEERRRIEEEEEEKNKERERAVEGVESVNRPLQSKEVRFHLPHTQFGDEQVRSIGEVSQLSSIIKSCNERIESTRKGLRNCWKPPMNGLTNSQFTQRAPWPPSKRHERYAGKRDISRLPLNHSWPPAQIYSCLSSKREPPSRS